jgi:hypothetical protein
MGDSLGTRFARRLGSGEQRDQDGGQYGPGKVTERAL